MRMPVLILTAMAGILLAAPARPQDKVNPKEESAKKVEKLRKERLATLTELVATATQMYQTGRADLDGLLEARLQLFQAELDAAQKQSDRFTLYQNLVEQLTEFEKIARGRLEAARGSTASVLRIKARRLEAEIHLEQAKAKQSEVKHQKPVVTSPQVKSITTTEQYVCQIRSQRHIKVRALQSGYLEEIPVKEGQAVKSGDVMFKVVPVLYKAKLDAELAEAKLAQLELQDAERMLKDKVVSPNEVARYQAKLARANAKMALAARELAFTEVRAPFAGIVDRLHEQQGSLVTERDILTTLSDNRVMWVYFHVPQARYLEYMAGLGKVKEGTVELVLGSGSKFAQTGTMAAIEADFNSETGTIAFRADFPNPEGLLRHGMTGSVLIHRMRNNAIVIPQRATFEILDRPYVYVVDKENVAHQREIVIEQALPDVFVIKKGVGVDDKIVFEGVREVHDGARVEFEFRPPEQILGRPDYHAK
jgi:membrane fusion protein, multidrug efflux system